MPGIAEFPIIVQRAQEYFGDLFAVEPQRQHFAEYLTNLMVASRKSVRGIAGEFPRGTDHILPQPLSQRRRLGRIRRQ